jgi:site-specific recombinase XerC
MLEVKYPPLAVADALYRAKPYDLIGQMGIVADHFGHLMSPTNRTRRRSSQRVGNYTAYLRRGHLASFIHALRARGYRLQYLSELRTKHVYAVVRAWDDQGLATRTLQTRLSAIRALFSWLGIAHRLPANRELLPAHRWRAPSAAKHDKTWAGNGWDVYEVASWIPETHFWIRYCLLLQKVFGLRMKEACLLRPWEADGGDVFVIEKGSKGGRRRSVPIESKEQRELLNRVKAFVPAGQALIGPQEVISWKTARRRYYRMLNRRLLITKKNTGVVPHGLRAEYACELYKQLTGEPPPVQGGKPVARKIDLRARLDIAIRLGHNRICVTSAYLGPMMRHQSRKSIAE